MYLLFICKGLRPCLLLFLYKRTAVLVFCYSSTKGLRPCLLLFIYKRTASLSFASHLQKDCVLVSTKGLRSLSFAIHLQKDCSPCLLLFIYKRTAVLVFCYSSTKGLWSLSFAIHLQKDCSPCLLLFIYKRTVVLVFCYSSTKGLRPCLLLFIYKRTASLSFAIHLFVYLLFVLMECRSRFCHLSLFSHSLRRNTALVTANSLQRKMLSLFSTVLSLKDWCPGKSMGDCCSPQGW